MGMKGNEETLHFIALYDFIHCRKVHGMHVPDYLLEREDTIRRFAAELQSKINEGENRITGLRMGIGKLVDEICTRLETKNDDCKLYLYSAHDTTIMSLLMVFDMFNKEWPDFSASLCVELYQDQIGEKFVKVLYEKESKYFNQKGNKIEYLPIDKFLEEAKPYRIQDWDKECGNLKK